MWVNIGSGNGLLPDGTKPLPESVLTYHQRCSVAVTWESNDPATIVNDKFENYFLNLLPHLPGVNELMVWNMWQMCIFQGLQSLGAWIMALIQGH